MNHGCVPIVHAGSLAWLSGTPKWNRAIVNVISYTCAPPAMTSQKAVKKVYKYDSRFGSCLESLMFAWVSSLVLWFPPYAQQHANQQSKSSKRCVCVCVLRLLYTLSEVLCGQSESDEKLL